MWRFARLMHLLKRNTSYTDKLAGKIAASAEFDPGMPSVLMGYDFHLTPNGPQLIEINNNAGGLYVGDSRWLPQPQISEMPGALKERLQSMFASSWGNMVVLDEDVESQFMYPEMVAYAGLLSGQGRQAKVVSPEDIRVGDDGALYVGEMRLDAIYNRHTDFYLESPGLSQIRQAYLSHQVVLTPNPRSYALLGDKGRMVDWWRPGLLDNCLPAQDVCFIRSIVPETHMLSEIGSDHAWADRKSWVFKPAARHGGKGVLLGKAMSRKRLMQMDAAETVVQRYVAPSVVNVGGSDYKFDVRLFTHGEMLIAVAGRIWQGMVTNFRTPGSGWTSLDIS